MTDPVPFDNATAPRVHPPGALLRCDSDIVGVLVTSDGRHLVAIAPIAEGTTLFTLTGRESPAPTRHSVQLGPGLHLDPDGARDILDVGHRYYWRYLDHACEPATVIRDRAVIALRDIAVGDRVTFNYNTTEYDMAAPFRCRCGSARCAGMIRGARHLTPRQRARLAPLLAEYLR